MLLWLSMLYPFYPVCNEEKEQFANCSFLFYGGDLNGNATRKDIGTAAGNL